ncbi:MAG: RNA polymerase sigma factor [Planctomycetes bacterium]|nr:RNA polymerase sigma factor [Planctomycetota bacterium]
MPASIVEVEPMPLSEALKRLAHGRDGDAWTAVVDEMAEDLHRTACRLTGDPSTADDAVQETLLLLRDRASQFRPLSDDADGDARRWIMRIGINASLKLMRTRHRCAVRDRTHGAAASSADSSVSVEQTVIERENADLLRLALAELPEPVRAAIVLHHLDGVGFKQVAHELRCPVGTAKARVHRGLEAMRGKLAKAGMTMSSSLLVVGIGELPISAGSPMAKVAIYHALISAPRSASLDALPHAIASKGMIMTAKLALIAAAVACIGVAPFMFAQDDGAKAKASGPDAGAAVIPAPAMIADPATYAVIIVPNLPATFGHIDEAMEVIAPGQMPKGMQLNQLAQMVGDPDFANAAHTPSLIVVGAGVPLPSFAMVIPCLKPEIYVTAFSNMGLASKVVGAFAILAQTPDGVATGERAVAGYKELTAAPITSDLRLVIALDRLATTYGPFLQMGVRSMSGPGQGKMLPIVALEVAGFLAMAADISCVQIDLSLTAEALSVDQIIAAKADGALAKALVAPSPARQPTAAARLSNEPGMMSAVGRVPTQALFTYVTALLQRISSQPEAKGLITPELIQAISANSDALSGDFAVRATLSKDCSAMTTDVAWACADATKAEAAFDAILASFTGGDIGGMGLSVDLKKHERTVSGVPINRISYVIDESKVDPQQVETLRAVLRDNEIAFTKTFVLASQDPKGIDALIAGNGPGLATRAQKLFPSGKSGYFDTSLIDIVRTSPNLKSPPPGNALIAAFANLPDGEPVTGAWTTGSGRARIEYRVPLKPIADLVKAFRTLTETAAPAPEPRQF